MNLTVVTMGPGSREYLTLGAMDRMRAADRLVLRTARSDAARYLSEQGIAYSSLDALYESSEDFDELNAKITAYFTALPDDANVVYAVADAVTDETAAALGDVIPITVFAGVSAAEPLVAAAPQRGQIKRCAAYALEVTDAQHALIVTEIDSRELAGKIKLELLKWYASSHETLFFAPSENAARAYVAVPLEDIDRQKKYDHTCAVLLPPVPVERKERFDLYDLVRVMDILRGENGCPWDKEQTHQSLRPYLIEEAYETAAAIDEEDWTHVADELGDVLLQVVFQASIARSTGTFELSDITSDICAKMISRHRHIFGGETCKTSADVLNRWEQIKREERGFKTASDALMNVPAGLPPLMRAEKVQKKAANVGFDWDSAREALPKIHEEADELLAELIAGRDPTEETGDLLFSCVNVARLAGVEAETALMRANEKFIRRFKAMETSIKLDGKALEDLTLSEMDVYWNRNKQCPSTAFGLCQYEKEDSQ